MKSWLLIAGVVLVTVAVGDGLKCYVCKWDGAGESKCTKIEDKGKDTMCDGAAKSCEKTVSSDKTKWERKCSNTPVMPEKDNSMENCKENVAGYGDKSCKYNCNGDLCNGATGLGGSVTIGLLLAALSSIYVYSL